MLPKKNIFVTSRAIQGNFYLVNKFNAYLLEETEQFIWECIDGENTERDIVDKVANKYNMDPYAIESDIKEFMGSLKKDNLIK